MHDTHLHNKRSFTNIKQETAVDTNFGNILRQTINLSAFISCITSVYFKHYVMRIFKPY